MALDFPTSPSITDIHNAANGLQYVFDGVKWTSQGTYNSGAINAQKLDDISSSFNGVLTTFDLKVDNSIVKPAGAESVQIVLAGVLQEPQTAYTIHSTNGTITFDAAPANGTEFFGVIFSRLPITDFGDGTVTNVKVSANAGIDGTKINPNFGTQSITGVTTTQDATDNTTKLASTAFVQTAISNLVDSSPEALNTLNELAAALGDDASFSTTITTSIATKAPLASPTFTGTVSGVSYDDLDNLPTGAELTTAIASTDFTESVQDIVGAMVTGNTETGITVDYVEGNQDGVGKLNFTASSSTSTSQTFVDNAKAIFGTNNDGLEIYHDGINSIIDDQGTGSLILFGSDIILQKHVDSGAATEKMAHFAQGGAASLYFDYANHNTAKLATSASGVTIDGTASATTFSGSGASLTSLPSSALTGALPALDGSNLTNLVASVNSANELVLNDDTRLKLGTDDADRLELHWKNSENRGYIDSDGFLTITSYPATPNSDVSISLQHSGAPRLDLYQAGVKWHGDLYCDNNSKLRIGSDSGTKGLEIYHNGTNTIIDDQGTGDLLVYGSNIYFEKDGTTSGNEEYMAKFIADGAVELYHGDNINYGKKLATTAIGISITGLIQVSGTVDGRDLATDGTKLDGIASNANNYSLPTASASTLGGIKVGSNLSISSGVLNSNPPDPTATQINNAFPDNGNLILGSGTGDDTLKLYYGSSSGAYFGKITADSGVHLQYDGANRLETHSAGVKWIGDLNCDDQQYIKLGDSADMTLRHDASGSTDYGVISVGNSSQFRLQSFNNIELMCGDGSGGLDWSLFGSANAWTALYYQGNMRLYTALIGTVIIGDLIPNTHNSYDLGNTSFKWDDVYATNGTIQTSDRNEKNTIVDSDLGLSFVNQLKPVSYKYNGKTRTHYGFIAQDVETTLSDISKSTTEFAGFIKTDISEELYKEEDPDVFNKTKNIGDIKTAAHTSYGLRYGEFMAPLVKAIQELSAKVAVLEAK